MIHYVSTWTKRRLFQEFLEGHGAPVAPGFTLWDWEGVSGLDVLPAGTWVMADLDGLGPAGLELAARARDALTGAGYRVLNDPRRTLRRFELLRALHRAGVNRFRAVRADDDVSGLRYPVFVRGASDHVGPFGDLLRSPAEVASALARARALGMDVDDLIVVEYEHTADADGLFRKFGVLVLGQRLVPQHLFGSRDWMIKSRSMVFTMPLAREEMAWVRDFPDEAQLRRAVEIAGVEFGRVDYSRGPDGRIQVWEVNLTPTLGPGNRSGPEPAEEVVELRTARLRLSYDMFVDVWRELQETAPGGPPVPLRVPEPVREGTRRELAPRSDGAALIHAIRAKAHFSRW